jgi:hypothetical protein
LRILGIERKVAKDPALDPVTLGIDGDRLRHLDRGIWKDRDVGVVIADDFLSLRAACHPENKKQSGTQAEERGHV